MQVSPLVTNYSHLLWTDFKWINSVILHLLLQNLKKKKNLNCFCFCVNPISWSEVFLSFSWIISFIMVYQICFPAIIFASFVGRFSFKSLIMRVWMEVYCLILPLHPSLLHSFSVCGCVCVHGVACKEYYDYILFLRICVYIYVFVDLVKRGVLTLLGEIQRYRNDCCCYYQYSIA